MVVAGAEAQAKYYCFFNNYRQDEKCCSWEGKKIVFLTGILQKQASKAHGRKARISAPRPCLTETKTPNPEESSMAHYILLLCLCQILIHVRT